MQNQVQISPTGPLLIPNTRLNTLTLMGTAEQIALAEQMIPVYDRMVPQVAIEVSLVEIRDISNKELGVGYGQDRENVAVGFNNTTASPAVPGTVSGLTAGFLTNNSTNPATSVFRWLSGPVQPSRAIAMQVNALLRTSRAKVLANPTIIATHDQEAVISMMDEIIQSVTVNVNPTTGGPGALQRTFEAEIGQAGIALQLWPKVGSDGTIRMTVTPNISSVAEVRVDPLSGGRITLLSRRNVSAQQVTLRDGQSLVMAGFIDDRDTDNLSKIPGLGDMPILGALARSSARSRQRSELVLILTPHIVTKPSDVIPGGGTVAPVSSQQQLTPRPQTTTAP
jgi:type II secretory pathway component GspD/PulD (secretin)